MDVKLMMMMMMRPTDSPDWILVAVVLHCPIGPAFCNLVFDTKIQEIL